LFFAFNELPHCQQEASGLAKAIVLIPL